jgi:hypothetical protein
MVDGHTALFHDLLEVPIAQRVGRIAKTSITALFTLNALVNRALVDVFSHF